MSWRRLWQRVRHARIVQVVAVYLGASWVVLQIASTLVEALTLPTWVMPVAIILLLIGLLVIVATAWVQSLPATTAREEAGEVPRDWQIAPRDALSSLRQGRLPHLTWGRSVVGGIVVLSLLFGGAGMYVGLTEGNGLRLGPSRAQASEAAEGIAVVPFEVRGQELEIWREGMMDLLSNGLDGVGGFRTIDSRTVMARWHSVVGAGGAADLESTLAVARAVGARFALEGSVVGLGKNVRLVANVYDLDTEREVATGSVEGPADDVLRLVDELAVGTMRSLLTSLGRGVAGNISAETITTASLPALRAFLEGEAHYRKGRFAEAVQSYERAVAADTTFAIALVRLSEAYGWLEDANSERMQEVGERAFAQKHRLSPRFQFVMDGWNALNHGSAAGTASLKEAVRKYPDDPEAWFLLAETYIHVGGSTYGTDEELWQALQRATSLDPNFAPYLVHVAEFATLRGDRQLAEATLQKYEALTGQLRDMDHLKLAMPLLLGTDEEARLALESARDVPERTFQIFDGTFGRRHDRFDREAALWQKAGQTTGRNAAMQLYYAASMGQLERGTALLAEPAVTPALRAIFWAHANAVWDITPPAGAMTDEMCDDPTYNQPCHVYVGVIAARLGRWADNSRAAARLREEMRKVADSLPEVAAQRENSARVVDGAAAWRRGNVQRGRELLQQAAGTSSFTSDRARTELAWLEAEAGRSEEAVRHFRSVLTGFTRPIALYGLARMHEQLRQPEEAQRAWASLATLTSSADDLARVREIREALARMTREPQ